MSNIGDTLYATTVLNEDWIARLEVCCPGIDPYRIASPKRPSLFLRFLTAWANAFTKGYSPEEWDR